MDSKPRYRVGAVGLDPRDWRLIEIVFKHSQYNRFEFTLVDDVAPGAIDILIANTLDPNGVKAVAAIRSEGRDLPVIAAVPRGAPSSARHAISIDRLTLQLLPILNRVVERELLDAGRRAATTGFTQGKPQLRVMTDGEPAVGAKGAAGLFEKPDAPPCQAPGAPMPPSIDPAGPDARGVSPPIVQTPRLGAPSDEIESPATIPMRFDEPGATPAATVLDAQSASAPREAARPITPRSAASEAVPVRAAVPAGAPVSSSVSVPDRVVAPAPMADPAAPASYATGSNLVRFPMGRSPAVVEPPRLRVLVVDDSPTVRQQLTAAFQRMGMACDAVSSAGAAIERLHEVHVDLVLADVVMPDMDGYKLTREIKRNKVLRQIPVIILTARSSPFDLARGALAGCDAFLTKPVPLKALQAAVFKQLRKSLAIDDLDLLLERAEPTSRENSESELVSRLQARQGEA